MPRSERAILESRANGRAAEAPVTPDDVAPTLASARDALAAIANDRSSRETPAIEPGQHVHGPPTGGLHRRGTSVSNGNTRRSTVRRADGAAERISSR